MRVCIGGPAPGRSAQKMVRRVAFKRLAVFAHRSAQCVDSVARLSAAAAGLTPTRTVRLCAASLRLMTGFVYLPATTIERHGRRIDRQWQQALQAGCG
ncbi:MULTISPECIES: hypothetical protein [Xanthomonas]|uniref:Uncharacterized protein n=1 Tax=Xanthomonas phaseoli pv. dieffenbachiae TaxID=92828 RepID=A0A0Q0GML1_9XANT|nr:MULTISPECIES: hypothetical protein [Xanthomonas]MBO9748182.1 hypothetical protein [Xanthomonas phaseoli pv. dieffenbachiae]MBO9750355.1 hypothetical protein [Xanthomonas phaseoli pv. dieffenbachiae]MBO9767123.1 hypothetical protein [Xanthomonas phaseoli pv. dieffenbachiae]MBO9775161.1 hypothetical protein [Xanthomonas phaseoli pv. dieffenbachiae]MBO9779472.1 hypothetical protein [Xanthomonas phaseoli pv. dieffenbachiae]